jgi:hypothetical protein
VIFFNNGIRGGEEEEITLATQGVQKNKGFVAIQIMPLIELYSFQH